MGVTRDAVDHSVSSLPQITCDRNQIAGNNDKFVSEQWDIGSEQPDMSGKGIGELDSGEAQKNLAD
jgi:hypothetical protein